MRKCVKALSVLLCVTNLTGCAQVDALVGKVKGEKQITEEQAAASLDPVSKYNSNFKAEMGKTEFTFKEPRITGKQKYEGIPAGTKRVIMFITEGIYYPIYLPDYLEILTDNSRYIYAKDESISVSVVSGVDPDRFSSGLGITDAETLSPNLVVTGPKTRGPKQAAVHIVNDRAIVVRAYDNDVAFDKIVEGFKTSTYIEPKDTKIAITEHTRVLDSFPQRYTGFTSTVDAGLGDEVQKMYSYQDGCLNVTRQMRKFEDAKSLMEAIAVTAAEKAEADVVYKSDNMFYCEIGNITFALLQLNYNTCLSCYGIGDEARFNVVEFINYQK